MSYGYMTSYKKGMVFETCPLSKSGVKNLQAFGCETIHISLPEYDDRHSEIHINQVFF